MLKNIHKSTQHRSQRVNFNKQHQAMQNSQSAFFINKVIGGAMLSLIMLATLNQTVMAKEYCYQDDYITRANSGDQIRSGVMTPAKLAQERLGFPYKAKLTHVRVMDINSDTSKNTTLNKTQHNAQNESSSKQNTPFKLATVIPEPIAFQPYQGMKFTLLKSQQKNCQPCTVKQAEDTSLKNKIKGKVEQTVFLEFCTQKNLDNVNVELVFERF